MNPIIKIIKKTLDTQTAGILLSQKKSIEILFYNREKNELETVIGCLASFSLSGISVNLSSGQSLDLDFSRIKSIFDVDAQMTLHVGEIIYEQSAGGGRED